MRSITVGDLVGIHARHEPKKIALVYGDLELTYSQLYKRANQLIQALYSKGITKGDRVALLNKNSNHHMELEAATTCGIIKVTVNFRLAANEVKYILNDSGAKAIIFGLEYLPMILSIKKDLPELNTLICCGKNPEGIEEYEELLGQFSGDEPEETAEEYDVSMILYTSGTTGLPKGAMLTHRNLVQSTLDVFIISSKNTRMEPDDVVIIMVPLSHVGGATLQRATIYLGGKVVIPASNDFTTIFKTIEEQKVTYTWTVPTIINMMLNHPDFDKYDLSSLRVITYAAEPMPLSLLRLLNAKLPYVKTAQFYGSTENSPSATSLMAEDHIVAPDDAKKIKRLLSIGREMWGAKVKIFDDNDNELPPGEIGEVCTRSGGVMKGYWNRPDETAKALRNNWLHTGDLGYKDEDGYFFLVDRKKDLIVSGGENIYPREVERVLYDHPAVDVCAVIGVPDPKFREAVKAVIKLKKGYQPTEEEIINFCKEHIASYKKPRSVDFVDSIPMDSNGKILKRELRKKYWESDKITKIIGA